MTTQHPTSYPTSIELAGYKVIAVHAHPDDESITTGGTLYELASRGAHVTVVTCTLGEEGEVIGDTFADLVNDEHRGADQLGGFRLHELSQAISHTGAHGEFLGHAGKYRDSGMAGTQAHEHPRAFVLHTDEATADLRSIIERIAPDVVITYDPNGGYGHPDHIHAHTITHSAVSEMDEQERPLVLWTVSPRKEFTAATQTITDIPQGWSWIDENYIYDATWESHDLCLPLSSAGLAAKREAMRAHATQIWLADGSVSLTNPVAALGRGDHEVWALSNLVAQPLMDTEYFCVPQGVDVSQDPFFGSL